MDYEISVIVMSLIHLLVSIPPLRQILKIVWALLMMASLMQISWNLMLKIPLQMILKKPTILPIWTSPLMIKLSQM